MGVKLFLIGIIRMMSQTLFRGIIRMNVPLGQLAPGACPPKLYRLHLGTRVLAHTLTRSDAYTLSYLQP